MSAKLSLAILVSVLAINVARGVNAQTVNMPLNSSKQNIAPNKLSAPAALVLVENERDKYWLNAKHEVYKSTLELFAQEQSELDQKLYYSKLLAGSPAKKQIAITFDDGPHPLYTPRILDILKKYDAKATFFVVGERAEQNAYLIRAEIAAGHSVGNHTYDHVSLIKIPAEYVDTEIKACGEVLELITGKPCHLFRPPGGEYNTQVAEASEGLGYTMVLWTDDPGDYTSPGADVILKRTISKITPGGIILIHDGIDQTIQVLPQILDYLKTNGYETITIDEMLDERKREAPAAKL